MKQRRVLIFLLISYVISLLLMLSLHYFVVYAQGLEYQKRDSERLFLGLATEELYLVNNKVKIDIKQFLNQHPSLQQRTYQVLLVDREKLTHIQTHLTEGRKENPEPLVGLPPRVDMNDPSSFSYRIDDDKLSGWIKSPSGEQISINLYHLPNERGSLSVLEWLPLALFILCCFYALSHFLIQVQLWRQTLNYATAMSSPNQSRKYNNYKALTFEQVKAPQEFIRLGHALSRANYQLHHRSRQLDSLVSRFERLVNKAPLPIVFIQGDGVINFVNERFSYVFMVSLHTGKRINIKSLIEATDSQSETILDNLAEQKITRNISVVGRKNYEDYQMYLMPWFANNGQVQGFTLMFNNISHINKQLASNLAQINEQSARIADFERLWSVMGHELRTPLSGIIGMLDLLREGHLNPEQQETFVTLEQTAQTMLFMLNDMLDLAKMDAGKLQLSISDTNIMQMCRQVCDLMIGNARRQGIELLLFFDPSCVLTIATDEARLRQVLLNLIGNAIKFTRSGYVALKVSVVVTEGENTQHFIYFEVIDTGIGISQEEQRKLFSYFNQANNAISKTFGGTGLGLAISKNFVQMLGGEILLNSSPNQGSNFTVKIPISQENHQLVYQYQTDLSQICLLAVTSQQISHTQLASLCKHIGLPAVVKHLCDEDGIENSMKNSINAINDEFIQLQTSSEQPLTPVLLIEHEVLEEHKSLKELNQSNPESNLISNCFDKITGYESMAKILLSMTPERSLSNALLETFDSCLPKPLDVDYLISELIRLTQQSNVGEARISKLQHTFNEFLENMDSSTNASVESLAVDNTSGIVDSSLVESDGSNSNDKTNLSAGYADSDLDGNANNNTNNSTNNNEADNNERPLILIAEDNPVNLKVLSKALEKLDYRFISAGNGQEVLDILQGHRQEISLILMDCRMPVMDGLEATRRIREGEDSIPIIALTANDTDEDRETCLRTGMDNFLSKPIKKATLKDMLEKYVIG